MIEPSMLQPGNRVLVIANPATRHRIDDIVGILRATAPVGVELDVRITAAAGDARILTREHAAGAAMVVAVGGDGTVADVAGNISNVPLGIMTAGSTNIIGRELGIPTDPRAAAALLWGRHRVRTIDAGVCNGRLFLHMAGAGFDSRFFDLTNRELKRRVGWIAYLPAAARALTERPSRYHIRTNDNEFDVVSPLVLVANGASIIDPHIRLHREIRKDDGWLDLLVVTATKPVELARTLGRLATLHLEKSPYVLHQRVTTVEVTTETPMPVQLDGDVVEKTPVSFSILPLAVRIICPF